MDPKSLSGIDYVDGSLAKAFLSFINVLMLQKALILSTSEESYPKDFGEKLLQGSRIDFDFVVVGSGASGSLIARRLSDFLQFKVLLIEAGALPSTLSNVPYVFYNLPFTRESWNFSVKKQNNACLGFEKNTCNIHLGKTVGGTSSINNMQYVRANERDFNTWLVGGEEKWDMETLEPLYKLLEGCKSENCGNYGTNGPIHLESITDDDHPILQLLNDGAKAMKETIGEDESKLGFYHAKAFVKNGQRYDFAKAFLSKIKNRNNLYFVQNATVTKILFNSKKDKKVRGVLIKLQDKTLEIRCKREVVLTAGAINNPKILMESGIGNANYLRSFGIEPLAEVPQVGRNLQIQITLPIFVGIEHDIDESQQKTEIVDFIYEYLMHKRGRASKTNVHGFVGLLSLKPRAPPGRPNVQLHHYYFRKQDVFFENYLNKFHFQSEVIKSLLKHNQKYSILIFMPTLIKPKSRGKVVLNCDKVNDDRPKIMAGFFSDEENEDFGTLMHGFNYVKKLTLTPPYVKYKAKILRVDVPICRNYKTMNEFYGKCYVKSLAYPTSNVAGSVRMGTSSDAAAPLDERMCVKGVRGVRVADASVFPEMVTGNVQATEAVVAERVAEFMRKKWLKNYRNPPDFY